MKWIYGAVMSAAGTVMHSYRLNPKYIIAVDLNNQAMVVNGMKDIFTYREEDEELILKLIGGDEIE
jgi:hypothetical protein